MDGILDCSLGINAISPLIVAHMIVKKKGYLSVTITLQVVIYRDRYSADSLVTCFFLQRDPKNTKVPSLHQLFTLVYNLCLRILFSVNLQSATQRKEGGLRL